VQQRHIPHHLERLSVGIFAFNVPHIDSLLAEITLVVSVPRDIDIVAFEYQHSKPVEYLQLVVSHLLPYRREEELVYLGASGREVGPFDRTGLVVV
jgi:hypothetical protein